MAEINGQGYSRIVSGPSGVWLMYQKTFSGPLFLQRIVNGQPSGAAHRITPNSNFSHANYDITEDASGRITVGVFTSAGNAFGLFVTTSTDGRHWSAPQIIARNLNSPATSQLGAAQDGGGFAAFQLPEPGGCSGSQIDVAGVRLLRGHARPGAGQPQRRRAGRPRRRPVGLGVLHRRALRRHRRHRRGGLLPARPVQPDERRGGHLRRDPPQRPGDHPRRGRPDRDRPAAAHDQHDRRGPGRAARPRDRRHHAVSPGTPRRASRVRWTPTGTPCSTSTPRPRVAEGLPVRHQHRRADPARRRRHPGVAQAAGLHGRRHRPGHAPGRQRQRAEALLAAHRRARSHPRRAGGQGPQHRLRRHRQRVDRLGDGQHPRGHALLRDRRGRPLRRRRLHDGLVRRERAVPGGADLHRRLPRRLRRRL